jgi:hypothetical protein
MIITICMVKGTRVQKFLNREFRGALMKQQPDNKNYHDSDQRKNQRIRKPALAPVGKSQTKANQRLFLSGRSFS